MQPLDITVPTDTVLPGQTKIEQDMRDKKRIKLYYLNSITGKKVYYKKPKTERDHVIQTGRY